MNNLLIVLLMFSSIVISVISLGNLSYSIYKDYERRKAAKKRYEADPNLDFDTFAEFYSPTVTVGDVITVTCLLVVPIVNLITLVFIICKEAYIKSKLWWNEPVIDW